MNARVVVITGASSGIGAALARQLGSAGTRLVLAARRGAELHQVVEPFAQNAEIVVADVTHRDEVERIRDVALRTFERIYVWVNNVGRGITRPVLQLSDDEIDQMINVNLKSAIYGMQTAIPYFQEIGKGHVINISSFLGRVPIVPFRAIYSASKAALNVLTANLRMDLRESYPGICVSLVMPGIVNTDFHKNAIGGTPQYSPGIPGAQTADQVAEVIVELIKNPRAEVYTDPASAEIARKYREDPEAFEREITRRR